MHRSSRMALIAARPGPLRNSLFSLLTTLPGIDAVAESKGPESLLRLCSQLEPDLLVIEGALANEGLAQMLHEIRAKWQRSRVLVLVGNVEQERTAALAGADLILFSGCRARQLMQAMADLLEDQVQKNKEAEFTAASSL